MPQRQDDPTIQNEDELLRRVLPNDRIVYDERTQRHRPSSAVFCDRQSKDQEVSVNLASVLEIIGLSKESIMAGYEGFGLISLTAGAARDQKQLVCRDSRKDNPSHGLIVGNKPKGVKRNLAKASHVLIHPHPT